MADTTSAVAPVAAQDNTQAVTAEAVTTAAPEQHKGLEELARKERQLQKWHQKVKAELAAGKEELARKVAEYETGYISKSRIKEDLWGVLGEQGIDYNVITEQMLSAPNMADPATRALMAKLKQLEDKQTASERKAQEATQMQYQQAIKQITNEVKMVVDANPDFESIKETGTQQAVVELIEETFNAEGYLMDIEEAAKKVETYLVEEATKMSQLKKLQKLKTEQQTQAPEKQTQTDAKTIKTLTNAVQTQPTRRGSSEKERRERALAAFHGTLKG